MTKIDFWEGKKKVGKKNEKVIPSSGYLAWKAPEFAYLPKLADKGLICQTWQIPHIPTRGEQFVRSAVTQPKRRVLASRWCSGAVELGHIQLQGQGENYRAAVTS